MLNVDERWAVAVHEAGHAVVGRKMGIDICRVRLCAKARIGQTAGETFSRVPVKPDAEQLISAAVNTIAGPVAAAKVGWDGGFSEDVKSLCKLCKHLKPRLRTKVIDAACLLARRLVDDHWPEISRLAAELYRKTDLDANGIDSATKTKKQYLLIGG